MIISVNPRHVQLGLGLIGIGKPWGVVPHAVPTEAEAMALLEFAYESGIRYFDTAPSYGDGVSEERLGRFLQSLGTEERAQVTGATKFGEHWNRAAGEPYADHSFDALRRSLERSVERMGRVDVLQFIRPRRRHWRVGRGAGVGVRALAGYPADRAKCE